jgi:hypothetical protein
VVEGEQDCELSYVHVCCLVKVNDSVCESERRVSESEFVWIVCERYGYLSRC